LWQLVDTRLKFIFEKQGKKHSTAYRHVI